MCAVVLVPWCTRKAFYKGKGCWIVFGGSFSHYCTAGHFVNGSLMIETTCARPRITFPFGSWSEGFSFTGGQEKKTKLYTKPKTCSKIYLDFWDILRWCLQRNPKYNVPIFPASQFSVLPWKAYRKMFQRFAELVRRAVAVCRNQSGILYANFGATCFFFKYFFLRMTVVGKAGQANKSRKEW